MDNIPFRYDITGLAKDMDIDLATISNLYTEYFAEMKANIEESIKLYGSRDFIKLERVIHNIKGISVSLNVNDIYDAANKFDMKLKRDDFDTVTTDINNIINLYNAAKKDIIAFFKQNAVNI